MKNPIKFVFVLGLVFLLSLAGFSTSGYGQEKEITWWYWNISPDNLEELKSTVVEPFNQSHPDINLSVEVKGDKLRQLLRNAVLAGGGPDVIMSPGPTFAQKYVEQDALLPLDQYLEEKGLDQDIFPWALDVGRVKGKIYSIPGTYESMGIFYNKSLFEDKGWSVPTNRKEFVELAETMEAEGVTPVALGNSDWKFINEQIFSVYLNQYAGPDNVYKVLTGEKKLQDEVFVDSMEFLRDNFQNYWTSKDYSTLGNADYMTLVSTRQAAMTISGSWAFQWLEDDAFWPSDDEWGWAPFPALSDNTAYPTVSIGIGKALSVNKNSKHPEAAAEFITWLYTQREKIGQLANKLPGAFILPIELPDEVYPPDLDPAYKEHLQVIARASNAGNYGYTDWTFWPTSTQRYIIDETGNVMRGRTSPQEFLDDLQTKLEEDMEEGLMPPIPERDIAVD